MQMSKADLAEFHIQSINPLSLWNTVKGVGHGNNLEYAIRRCRELAEAAKGKNYLLIYRVVQHRGEPLYISHVQFDTVTHYNMRHNLKEVTQETA